MIDFILEFISTHFWTVSYALTYSLGTVCSIALITRFLRMFPTYIRTGSMGNEHAGIFFTNKECRDIRGMDFIKFKVRDFFTATHLETIFFDTVVCGITIAALHLLWVLFVGVGLVAATIFGVIGFVKYLRHQHVKKEEFHSALRGE